MKPRTVFYLKKAAQGILVSLFFLAALLIPGRDVIVGQMLLYETMPNYKMHTDVGLLFGAVPQPETVEVFSVQDNLEADSIILLPPTDDGEPADDGWLIGVADDIYQSDARSAPDPSQPEAHTYSAAPTEADVDKLTELGDLKSRMYTVDKATDVTAADFDIAAFMAADLTIDRDSPGPKVLVFHTHSTELYSDSVDETEGVVGLGRMLCKLLQDKYGIEALHVANRYDVVDGKSQILGAYERMEPDIQKILAENPTIEMVIDLHRDGVEGNRRLVTDIDGKPTAQVMFVNGLSKIYRDGVLMNIDSLPNPNRQTNLALSFRTQLSGNKLYPGLMRKTYLNAYRYSTHMLPKSLLVEIGAQTNTKDEAFRALEPLADALAAVVLR